MLALVLPSAGAYAVGERVKQACRADYYQYCSQYSVGTEELRQCMRKVGQGLSAPCLVALVEEGEITKADVEKATKASGKTSGPENTKKDPEAKSTITKQDEPKVALAGKGGKKKKSKAVQAADADKLDNGAPSKKAKAAKKGDGTKGKTDAKLKSGSALKTGKTAKAKKAGKKSASVEKDKKTKPGDAKTGTAKTEKHAKKGKAKKAGKAPKQTSDKTSSKTKKSEKAGPTKKAKKAAGGNP